MRCFDAFVLSFCFFNPFAFFANTAFFLSAFYIWPRRRADVRIPTSVGNDRTNGHSSYSVCSRALSRASCAVWLPSAYVYTRRHRLLLRYGCDVMGMAQGAHDSGGTLIRSCIREPRPLHQALSTNRGSRPTAFIYSRVQP